MKGILSLAIFVSMLAFARGPADCDFFRAIKLHASAGNSRATPKPSVPTTPLVLAPTSPLVPVDLKAKDLYRRLGLTPAASPAEIEMQFTRLSAQYSRDANWDAKDSLAIAYHDLSNPEIRARYDRSRRLVPAKVVTDTPPALSESPNAAKAPTAASQAKAVTADAKMVAARPKNSVKPVADAKDLYLRLGLRRNASAEDIDASYKILTKKYAAEKDHWKQLQLGQAYSLLKDSNARRRYNLRNLKAGLYADADAAEVSTVLDLQASGSDASSSRISGLMKSPAGAVLGGAATAGAIVLAKRGAAAVGGAPLTEGTVTASQTKSTTTAAGTAHANGSENGGQGVAPSQATQITEAQKAIAEFEQTHPTPVSPVAPEDSYVQKMRRSAAAFQALIKAKVPAIQIQSGLTQLHFNQQELDAHETMGGINAQAPAPVQEAQAEVATELKKFQELRKAAALAPVLGKPSGGAQQKAATQAKVLATAVEKLKKLKVAAHIKDTAPPNSQPNGSSGTVAHEAAPSTQPGGAQSPAGSSDGHDQDSLASAKNGRNANDSTDQTDKDDAGASGEKSSNSTKNNSTGSMGGDTSGYLDEAPDDPATLPAKAPESIWEKLFGWIPKLFAAIASGIASIFGHKSPSQ